MIRRLGLSWALLAGATFLAACGGGDAGAPGAKGDPGTKGGPGAMGDPGTKGDPGGGTASVNAVTPGRAFLERSVDIAISGNGTAWSDKTTVDFGAGVKVNKITLASPTALLANITVDVKAAVGARDITVKDAAGDSVFKGGFDVASPIVVTISGTPEQGGIVVGHAKNLDIENPFDLTTDGNPFGATYTNLVVNSGAGVNGQLVGASLYGADFALLLDVDAISAAQDLNLTSGPTGDTTSFTSPAALTVKARSATPITAGTKVDAMVAKAFDTGLYTYTAPAANVLLEMSVTSTDASAAPTIFLLPKTGKFADAIGSKRAFNISSKAADQYYLVVADTSGYAGFPYTLSVKAVSYTGSTETEPNDTDNKANPLATLPAFVSGATLTDKTDQDWFAITITAAQIGKKIHVVTTGADAQTDTVVDVFESDGSTSLGGPSGDLDYHEDFTSDPVAKAGTYYVQVAASSYFAAAHNGYDLFVELQ